MKCPYCGVEEESTACLQCGNPKVLNLFGDVPIGMFFVDKAHGGAWIKDSVRTACCTEDDAAFKKGACAGFFMDEEVFTYFQIT